MKTTIHLSPALSVLTFLIVYSKDVLPPTVMDESLIAQELSYKTLNKGMIKSYGNETIIKWNELLGASIDEKLPIPLEAKIYAMVTICMHDALNNIVPMYETYALNNAPPEANDISKMKLKQIADAAVSQAAREVMVALFPPASTAADALLDEVLSAISDEASKSKGVEIGKQVATAILQKRQRDFPFLFTSYSPSSSDPGVYQADFPPYQFANPPIWPANAVYALNLGNLQPFGIESSDQFINDVPYSLESREYARDYNEVKNLGCAGCTARTPEQTIIASFWVENLASSINRLARTLIIRYKLNGWESARLIALLEMGVMDSFIASFREKSEFVFWAPITAIRAGATDGNPETTANPTWISLRTTPPVFEFAATQAYGSGATSEILRLFFKTDKINFTTSSPYYLPGVERSFSSFADFSTEHAVSRIYLGHHFRHSVVVGEREGIELGRYVFGNNLRELGKIN